MSRQRVNLDRHMESLFPLPLSLELNRYRFKTCRLTSYVTLDQIAHSLSILTYKMDLKCLPDKGCHED